MMLRNLCLAVALTVTMTGAQAWAESQTVNPANVPDPAVLAKLDAILQEGVTAGVYPGAALIVGQPGKQYYARTVGKHTYEPTSPDVTLDTLWDLASVTKVVGTATAAMLAIQDGKLNLNDKVSSKIPGFEAGNKGAATLRHLMTHTSGLPAYATASVVEKQRRPDESTADALIRYYAGLKARFDPGTSYTYSCLNMQTTARIVEDAVHARLEDYMKARVFGPLEMKNTGYVLTPEQVERTTPSILAKGEPMRGKTHDPLANYHQSTGHCPGNAGLYSTANDLARYCSMILAGGQGPHGEVMNPSTVDLMLSVQTPPQIPERRALGWDVDTTYPWATSLNTTTDTLVLSHTGYTGTLIWIDKKTRTYVVFLTNRTFPDDGSKPKGAPSITSQRKAVLETVLKSLPAYASVVK